MAHLPPKPDFEVPPPSRYPPDYRSYGRPPPPSPPPPDRAYRERSAYPPRSPPRPRASGDSYVASRPADAYRSSRPSMDSYVASYERREDDRYRDPYRDREPPPRERDWERRERDYPPPEYRYRPREPGRDHVDWREREDRMRRWEEYERHERRAPERRDFSPRSREPDWRREPDRRHARDRPPELERTWVPRPSRSPPRRIVTATSTPARDRSPLSPRHRHRSPSPRQPSRPRSPSPRSVHRRPNEHWAGANDRKLGEHSISMSPRRSIERSPRGTAPRDRRDRSRVRRSRSRSRRADSRDSRHPGSHTVHAEQLRPPVSPRKPDIPTRPRSRSRTPVKEEIREEFLPPSTSRINEKGKLKAEPDTDRDVKMRDSSPLLAPSTREAVPQFRRRRSRSPVSSRNQGHTPSSPVSPQVPLTPSALPQKPEWARRSTTVSSTTPKADAVSPMQDTPELVITAPVIPQYKPKQSEIELELARIQSHHASLAAAHETSVKATRRALFEVELANMDLRLAEARRSIADAQVEKARAGVLGIDYVQEIPGTVE